MVQYIEEELPLFLEEEMPSDFVVRMRAAIRKFAECRRTIEESIARQKAATAALAKEVPLARPDVDVLGGLLEDRLRTDHQFRVEWEAAKRVGKRMGQPRRGKWSWLTRRPKKK